MQRVRRHQLGLFVGMVGMVVGSRARVAEEIEIIVRVVAVLMGMTVHRDHLGLSRML
ncbi:MULTISPECIES: hypothetical protein [Sinorhizobium]|uniref:Uncharacterized protein n=1 Tax=Sinorhizobium kummerowiae TaxID=158892 RepID=A0ABY8THN6_9HYPH|nr:MULTISPECIES: hypothetical protein [Sinorhizobium]WHS96248.1 hypothetical protein PZL22_005097 [Sinorhizobium kummerowiae]WQH41801.1 hypothetical protein VPK21_000428 [Sinorhizobium kummerowiae]